jgi:hypothetical protein
MVTFFTERDANAETVAEAVPSALFACARTFVSERVARRGCSVVTNEGEGVGFGFGLRAMVKSGRLEHSSVIDRHRDERSSRLL